MLRFALFCALLANAHAAAPALMPLPATARSAAGKLTIDSTFQAVLSGAPDGRLDAAIGRFVMQLSRQTGIPMFGLKDVAPKLRVECAAPGNDYPTLGENEAYTLDVTTEGATLKAATRAGALHGLATFAQLVTLGKDAAGNPLLAELQPVSKDLAALGNLGLKILDSLEKGQATPAGFVPAQTKELARMEKPNAEVSLAASRPVKALLNALKK